MSKISDIDKLLERCDVLEKRIKKLEGRLAGMALVSDCPRCGSKLDPGYVHGSKEGPVGHCTNPDCPVKGVES